MMANSISDKDVAKAKQLLKDAKSDNKSANSISNKDIAKAKQVLSGGKKKLPEAPKMPKEAKKIRNANKERTQRPPESAYEEMEMGFREGGLVRMGTFKGVF